MEIAKNKTTLTKKMLVAFQNRELFLKSWVIAVCALALIVISFRIDGGKIVLNSIPLLVIGCVAYPAYIGIVKLLFYKQNKSFIPVTIEYTFTESVIKLDGVSEMGREVAELPYNSLIKIKMTKKYTFLYINKTSALVLDNNCFTMGSIEKLRALLTYKFPDKLDSLSKRKEKREGEESANRPNFEQPNFEGDMQIKEEKTSSQEEVQSKSETMEKSVNGQVHTTEEVASEEVEASEQAKSEKEVKAEETQETKQESSDQE